MATIDTQIFMPWRFYTAPMDQQRAIASASIAMHPRTSHQANHARAARQML